jgi:hypothetical protein
MERAANVTQDFPTVSNAHHQPAISAPQVTLYRMAHVQFVLPSTQTAPLAIQSFVFRARTGTFWRTTLAITAPQFDSQDATHAILPDASHAIRVFTSTQSLAPVPHVSPSFRNAWSANSTVAHLVSVGTLSRQETAAFATRSTPTVSRALLKCAQPVSQGFSWRTGPAMFVRQSF